MDAFRKQKVMGFTLAELLISLAVLGVIATFTIPKVLNGQQDGQWNAIAKETVSMITGAYNAYRLENSPTAQTTIYDFTPYMNYVRVDTSALMDSNGGGTGTAQCGSSADVICLVLHNGGMVRFQGSRCFFGTTDKHSVSIALDPDGKVPGDTGINGPGKTVDFWLYFNGRITSSEHLLTDTIRGQGGCGSAITYQPAAGRDPDWFEW